MHRPDLFKRVCKGDETWFVGPHDMPVGEPVSHNPSGFKWWVEDNWRCDLLPDGTQGSERPRPLTPQVNFINRWLQAMNGPTVVYVHGPDSDDERAWMRQTFGAAACSRPVRQVRDMLRMPDVDVVVVENMPYRDFNFCLGPDPRVICADPNRTSFGSTRVETKTTRLAKAEMYVYKSRVKFSERSLEFRRKVDFVIDFSDGAPLQTRGDGEAFAAAIRRVRTWAPA